MGEAHFSLNGYVNWKNCVPWEDKNHHDMTSIRWHETNMTMKCVIKVSYFLVEFAAGLRMCTLTSGRYEIMMPNYAIPESQQIKAVSDVIWIPEDATPDVRHLLNVSKHSSLLAKLIIVYFIVLYSCFSTLVFGSNFNRCLAVRIPEIRILPIQFTNCTWFERYYYVTELSLSKLSIIINILF